VVDFSAIPRRTATHEAGHGVIAEVPELRVDEIRLENFQDGWTELEKIVEPEDPAQAAVLHQRQGGVAVAGSHAVRLLLGEEAAAAEAAQNLDHAEKDSAKAATYAELVADFTGADPEAILARFDEDTVALLRQPHIKRAVERVASMVKEAGRNGVRGDAIRRVIAEESPGPLPPSTRPSVLPSSPST
jgi:hypothetical protein